MEKFLAIAIFIVVIIAVIIVALPAQAEVPTNRQYDVEMAAYNIAMSVMDEADTTPHHYERLMLARQIIASPGAMASKLIKMAEAKVWTEVAWTDTTPTRAAIRTNMEGVWDYVAIATYGDPPVKPE